MRTRTGYSFKTAVGHLPEVISRLKECNFEHAPISDRLSTHGFVRWTKLCKEAGLKPVYGVELPVVEEVGVKKSPTDHWTFFAKGALRPLHDLIYRCTTHGGLTYREATKAPGLIKITGNRTILSLVPKVVTKDDLYIGLAPSTPVGLYRAAKKSGHRFIATSDNVYTRQGDLEFYRVTLGFRASTQVYPQHILDDGEWSASIPFADKQDIKSALANRASCLKSCTATLETASLFVPTKPHSLRALCVKGAAHLGVDLKRPVYSERLDRELEVIAEKKYEDYFHIVADLMAFAREHMVVGPARGSSCGSLVCYLLGITAIDPIPYDLVFERFIDVTRTDLPDIDLDFSDKRRHLVLDYVAKKYGREHVARLGSVNMLQAKSALNFVGGALKIPGWQITEVGNTVVKRAGGDSRADSTVLDTLEGTEVGRKLLKDFPGAILAARMEEHPASAGQHAAGVVLTKGEVLDHVAIDASTGAAMCDKSDAEVLNLLKIDMLGLTQLSTFERTLELIGEIPRSTFLERIPLDDKSAFTVLNDLKLSGIFQFDPNSTMASLLKELVRDNPGRIEYVEDIIALTALVRPGPMGSGQSHDWVQRRIGLKPVSYLHPLLEKYLRPTYGIIVYQEQIMQIAREIGELSWDEVTVVRKAMSKSMGKEYFDQYGDKWKAGARKNLSGLSKGEIDKFWNDMCLAGDTKIKLASHLAFKDKSFGKDGITISELYDRYENNPSSVTKRKKLRPLLVSLYPDGTGKPQKAINIVKSGKKICWRYDFNDGSFVTCTPDHKFIVNGEWSDIGSSVLGDHFSSTTKGYHQRGLRGLSPKIGKGGGSRDSRGQFKGNNFSTYEIEFRNKMRGETCCDCPKAGCEVHHLDFVGGRVKPKAVVWICSSCHRKRHAKGRHSFWTEGEVLETKILIDKTEVGMKEVYDIRMPEHHNFILHNGLVAHNCGYGLWAFNRSHSVAYGTVSYWSCWLKAHHPVEFAAATLDAQSDVAKQVLLLRDLKSEGVGYVPIDPERSTDRWEIRKKGRSSVLLGPLSNIKGVGPKMMEEILDARRTKTPLRASLVKRLERARTSLDTLSPIADAVSKLHPDLSQIGIVTTPTPIVDAVEGERAVVLVGKITKIAPLDENETARVARRGKRVSGPTSAINLYLADDTGEIFCKIGRFDYNSCKGKDFVAQARPRKSLYALKGTINLFGFRMLKVEQVKYLGEIES